MRTDHVFYVIAMVWFIVALYFAYMPQVANPTVAWISVIIGICFIGAGYMLGRKGASTISVVSTATVIEKKTENPRVNVATELKTAEIEMKTPSEEGSSERRVTRKRRRKTV
jgi:hypothetical protein